jgi:hypothetical protein
MKDENGFRGSRVEKRRLFEPGQLVLSFRGDLGVVLSEKAFHQVRSRFKEGHRPGHFFAPGCCQNPDYVTQVPVFFEDGTYDVMRAMNIRKKPDLPGAKREELEKRMSAGIKDKHPGRQGEGPGLTR